MKVVREYPIFRTVPTMMPRGAKIIGVHSKGYRNQNIHVLAIVETTAALVTRKTVIIGTDRPIPREILAFGTYVGTAYHVNGGLDFHIFDLGETEDFGDAAREGEAERAVGELNAFHFPRQSDLEGSRNE
jgi:hypothetical protein